VGGLFGLAGDVKPADQAGVVMALERRLAEAQWPRADTRDARRGYNPKTPAELAALAPGLDWPAFRAAAQVPAGAPVIVRQPSYLAAFAGLVASEPLATWKLYLQARRLDAAALVLPAGFRDASFEFHDKAMRGLARPPARWQSAIAAMDPVLGEATGQLYVEQYFPPVARARAQALVANLMKAYSASIDGLAWMSPATKAAAHQKLSRYAVKIGYPDTWRDYTGFDVRAGDAFGNQERGAAFEYRRRIVRVGAKVDRREWSMTPQTVNAYYNRSANEIVFPAAILQPPFFNASADDAINYGAIGAVIGHEISHGFDDQGSQYDGEGRLRNWWTDADRKAFEAITEKLVDQYHGYAPLPGHPLDGRLTLGENIADLSGLQIAFKAWRASLAGKPSAVIDGMTGEQRFFLGFAQVWREKTRDERLLESIVTNPHAPGRFRADGAAINADAFHEAFGTRPGDAMWKAPEDRIRLW
jgi:putative endopeptidase